MKKMIGSVVMFVLVALFSSHVNGSVTSKTLPKGVWKFDFLHQNYDVEKAGAIRSGLTSQLSDLTNYSTIDLNKGTMNDLPAFRGLDLAIKANPGLAGALTGVNLDTKLLDQWNKKRVKFDVAYGLDDKLTLFANFAHERAFIDYTDEYVDETKRLNDGAAGALDSSITVVPDKATSSGLRDVFIGFKYNVMDNFSVAMKTSFGPLRIGTAPSEKKQSDGVQELETGKDYDTYQFVGYYDLKTDIMPINLMFGYTHFSAGFQNFLDNKNIRIKLGDMMILGVGSTYSVDKFTVDGSLTMVRHGKDEFKGGSLSGIDGTSSYQELPDSDGTTVIANLQLNYNHKEFLRFFVGSMMFLSNDATGQIYESPGRLEPGNTLRFGATLFYK